MSYYAYLTPPDVNNNDDYITNNKNIRYLNQRSPTTYTNNDLYNPSNITSSSTYKHNYNQSPSYARTQKIDLKPNYYDQPSTNYSFDREEHNHSFTRSIFNNSENVFSKSTSNLSSNLSSYNEREQRRRFFLFNEN